MAENDQSEKRGRWHLPVREELELHRSARAFCMQAFHSSESGEESPGYQFVIQEMAEIAEILGPDPPEYA